jgi:hypothetical protein
MRMVTLERTDSEALRRARGRQFARSWRLTTSTVSRVPFDQVP